MNTEHPTVRFDGQDHPALAVDAIGGEPLGIIAGDAHIKLLTWHGIPEPYTVDNAQTVYLTVSAAYLVAEALQAAADRVIAKALDRQDGGTNT